MTKSGRSWMPAVEPPPVCGAPAGTELNCDATSGPQSAGAVAASGSDGTNGLFSVVAAFGAVAGVRPWTTITALFVSMAFIVVAFSVIVRLYV